MTRRDAPGARRGRGKPGAVALLFATFAITALCSGRGEAQPGRDKEAPPPREREPPAPPGDQGERQRSIHGRSRVDANITEQDVAEQYIVVLRPGRDPRGVANGAQANPKHVYEKALRGFTARLNQGQLNALRRHADVDYIEPDQLVQIETDQAMAASGQPWGLDRIDQHALPLDRRYRYFSQATGVRVYILDTGIQRSHPDLPNVISEFDALGGNGEDCHGHGTHMAGIVGGNTHGVAKGAALRSVRVLGCSGTGAVSAVLAGMDWVADHHVKPAVANLSLGIAKSTALNQATEALVASGVFVTVAAGNYPLLDACNVSPASAPSAFTVAAADISDQPYARSAAGTCVDMYAPGVNILSSSLGGGTLSRSGSSMAAAHVAGAAALYKAHQGDASASTISSYLASVATRSALQGLRTGTPNLLLFQPF